MGEFRSDIAEESRRLRGHLGPGAEKQLVDNMLAEDAYRHDYEAMPPRDHKVPEMSVMDTAFMSPETHDILGYQSHERARDRQLESENQPLIPDYPEDYAMAATGVYGVGKGLAQYGLKQLARPRRLQHLKNVVRPDRHAQRSARLHGLEIDPKIEDLFGNMSKSQKTKMAAKHSKPDKFKQAMKFKQDQLNAKLAKAQQKFKPKDTVHPDSLLDPIDIAEDYQLSDDLMGLLEDNHELLKGHVDPYLPAQEMLERSFQVIEDSKLPFTTFGGQGSNLPVPKWMSAPTKTMRIPPASANSIIPAAVLHQSMTE